MKKEEFINCVLLRKFQVDKPIKGVVKQIREDLRIYDELLEGKMSKLIKEL